MRRRKRFNLRLVALAFALAAVAAPSAQAMPPPEDLPGDQVRALREAKAARAPVLKAVKSTQARLPRRPIREYEPGENG